MKPKQSPKKDRHPSEPSLGRRPLEITEKELKNLCRIQCTRSEIASFFECDETTIDRHLRALGYKDFTTFYKIHSQGGKISLRRAQLKKAIEGENPAMLIWLGKQYLDQSDKNEHSINPDKSWIKMGYDDGRRSKSRSKNNEEK